MAEILPETRGYLKQFVERYHRGYMEAFYELRPGKGYGYRFHRSTEVYDCLGNITTMFEEVDPDFPIPGSFASPIAMARWISACAQFLSDQIVLLDQISRETPDRDTGLARPLVEARRIAQDLSDAFEHVRSLSEIKELLPPLVVGDKHPAATVADSATTTDRPSGVSSHSAAHEHLAASDSERGGGKEVSMSGARHVSSRKAPASMQDTEDKVSDTTFDVAIVCALRDPELSKVEAVGGRKWVSYPGGPRDPTTYRVTTVTTAQGTRLRVIAAAPTQMGMPASAVLASKMISRFQPRLVAMVGIAAGVRGDKQGFGDILAPDITFDYGSGKISLDSAGKIRFEPNHNPIIIDPRLRARLMDWSKRNPQLDEIRNAWVGNKPNTVLEMHVGPLGSGAAVVNTSAPVDEIIEHWRKLIGIEMEAYGVHVACRETVSPAPVYLCMKSICDFASKKTDDWQAYAAYTAAELFFRFLIAEWDQLHLPPVSPP